MQRVDLRGCRVRAILALVAAVTASIVLTAGFGGSAQTVRNAPAHLCPPFC